MSQTKETTTKQEKVRKQRKRLKKQTKRRKINKKLSTKFGLRGFGVSGNLDFFFGSISTYKDSGIIKENHQKSAKITIKHHHHHHINNHKTSPSHHITITTSPTSSPPPQRHINTTKPLSSLSSLCASNYPTTLPSYVHFNQPKGHPPPHYSFARPEQK